MIRLYDPGLEPACRDFLDIHPRANYCHDPAWVSVIREAYGKDAFLYVRTDPVSGEVKGLAPACHLASAAFGKNLVCLPYLDYGGILAADAETEDLLRDKLVAEAQSRRARLEIRSRDPLCNPARTSPAHAADPPASRPPLYFPRLGFIRSNSHHIHCRTFDLLRPFRRPRRHRVSGPASGE